MDSAKESVISLSKYFSSKNSKLTFGFIFINILEIVSSKHGFIICNNRTIDLSLNSFLLKIFVTIAVWEESRHPWFSLPQDMPPKRFAKQG